jgi:hypothetical protein
VILTVYWASKDDTGGTYSVIEIKVFPNGGPIPQ